MGGLGDRIRSFLVDGRPVVTGTVAVGDAWAYTNPTLGRGVPMGFLQAIVLRDAVRAAGGRPVDLVLRWAEGTAQVLEPWYRATRVADEARLAELEADRLGTPYVPADPRARMGKALTAAAGRDPEILRAMLEIAGTLTLPDDVLARPGVADRVMAAGGDAPQYPLPGPDRHELLASTGLTTAAR
jgi:flavin-dependent dehydrogenase